MLRLCFLQQWYGLADEALEDAVYDSHTMRAFLGINLACDPVPDATIFNAPCSTKNKDRARDPEMPQTKKGCSSTLWEKWRREQRPKDVGRVMW